MEVEHDPAAYALVRSFNADGSPAWAAMAVEVEGELDRRGLA